MKGLIRLVIISLGLALALPTVADPLESVLEVFLVSEEKVDDELVEKLVPVDSAEPGAVIEYVLTYTNTSEEPLTGFAIKTPIPASTAYVAESADADVKSDFRVSVDSGESFEAEPVTRIVIENGKSKEIVIPPSEYNALSWDVKKKLKAGKSMVMRYRVTID